MAVRLDLARKDLALLDALVTVTTYSYILSCMMLVIVMMPFMMLMMLHMLLSLIILSILLLFLFFGVGDELLLGGSNLLSLGGRILAQLLSLERCNLKRHPSLLRCCGCPVRWPCDHVSGGDGVTVTGGAR